MQDKVGQMPTIASIWLTDPPVRISDHLKEVVVWRKKYQSDKNACKEIFLHPAHRSPPHSGAAQEISGCYDSSDG